MAKGSRARKIFVRAFSFLCFFLCHWIVCGKIISKQNWGGMDVKDLEDVGRYSAEGYSFYTEKDAALAENERRKVEYLEARLDYKHPESILRIYSKAIEDRVFKSPVGHYFLKNLQNFLLKQPDIDKSKVADIPLYVSYDGEFRERPNPARNRLRETGDAQPKQKQSSVLPVSLILNACLIVAVIAMFYITLHSEQPNILNYEKTLTNKYASWEQQLTEREQKIRMKERELDISE